MIHITLTSGLIFDQDHRRGLETYALEVTAPQTPLVDPDYETLTPGARRYSWYGYHGAAAGFCVGTHCVGGGFEGRRGCEGRVGEEG